ncbi:hypothetical protein GCM10009840_23440 [Pseudolysinimonas kribbensis]|uniref:Uncharacterized protein n=1 Tax=Pseudolysinimonas kribbensis TaxID=433641 RepID=A0ABQ6K9I0_9MICO|nr:hypothetical protein [Pseudolysinimonas kribbensis]GMA96908.1 hypothetical protein GCM10025881_37320 [Pseudolysinimonas kribbensis]
MNGYSDQPGARVEFEDVILLGGDSFTLDLRDPADRGDPDADVPEPSSEDELPGIDLDADPAPEQQTSPPPIWRSCRVSCHVRRDPTAPCRRSATTVSGSTARTSLRSHMPSR